MSNTPIIPSSHRDLVERPLLAMLATTLPDGTPQVTPVWFSYDGQHFYFNTAQGRLKARAIEKTPYVAILIMDPNNGFRYIQVRGSVTANEAEGRANINELCLRYTGSPVYKFGPPDEVRIKYTLTPEHIQVLG
ncbi:MAG: PPOX class F420-dependent oxidoreductase [Chloroflexota bacterium]|jgi:PPOX class probable F420-dependent enzyme|nr:PPOX class F420-dependent oxidoreductase [Chloroflexota bacterium]